MGDEAAASYSPTQFARAVPSAQRSLTTVFGMGTGVASPPLPPPQNGCRMSGIGGRKKTEADKTDVGYRVSDIGQKPKPDVGKSRNRHTLKAYFRIGVTGFTSRWFLAKEVAAGCRSY